MRDYIENRVKYEAAHILETKDTIRATAKVFGISKSTVFKDMAERLPKVNPQVYQEIKQVMEEHIDVRHIHGGEATKLKWQQMDMEGSTV
jgi:putative DeoR family transcriptional regulator (stage III sporulation protein D)